MRSQKEIKADLLAALEAAGDNEFEGTGFKRKRGSLEYIRTIDDALQIISFSADYFPKYQKDKELHIHPAMHVAMNSVTDAALRLVAGNRALLANAPDTIVNQPIEFTAPNAEHVRWFASGPNEMKECVVEISVFVKKWVIPFFDKLATADDLISVYENSDDRMMKQRHWYLFVAAAHLTKGREREALAVLEKNLGAPGLRKRYASAFETLSSA